MSSSAVPASSRSSRGNPTAAAPRTRNRSGSNSKRPFSNVQESTSNNTKLSAQFLLDFERRGCCLTRGLLQPEHLQPVRECVKSVIEKDKLQALKHRVRVLCPAETTQDLDAVRSPQQALRLIAAQGSSELGFLQFFNLHRSHPAIAQVVRSKQLTSVAAQLLGVKRLRLYQDCVFLKEPGYAETNWHSDLRMAPLDTNDFITAWVPLRPIKGGENDSGLVFALGSHRDFALPFWHDLQGRDLQDRGYDLDDTGPMAVGDVSWHHGWLLHAAAPQPHNTPPRLALAISFFADGASLLARKSDPSMKADMLHDEDAESYGSWLNEMQDGAVARHPQLPVVFP